MLIPQEIPITEVSRLLNIAEKHIRQLPGGGQKQVFVVNNGGNKTVLKFVQTSFRSTGSPSFNNYDAITKRTLREIELMRVYSAEELPSLDELIYNENYNSGGAKFIVFSEKFIGDSSLRDLLTAGPIDINEVVAIIEDISNAINIYWGKGKIVHRDIKPENIMKSDNTSRFVLIDSGVHFSPVHGSVSSGIIGTIPYLSPEQVIGNRNELDSRSDLYCLGIVAYEALTGNHPYFDLSAVSGMSEDQVREIIINTKPKSFSEYQGLEVDKWLTDLITSLLSKRKFYRPRNATKVIDILEGASS